MPTVVFMRHAKTTYNKERIFAGRIDCEVVKEGLEEVKKSFEYDKDFFDIVYCSPLKRTKQTLSAIIPNKEPIIDERIIERNMGQLEGKPYDSVDPIKVEHYFNGIEVPPEGEPEEEVKKRVCDFVEELFQNYQNENILVLSHGGVLKIIQKVFLSSAENKILANGKTLVVEQKDFEQYQNAKKLQNNKNM